MVQAWSLGVEVVFYAFLPVYALLVRRLLRGADPVPRVRGELACLAGLFGLGLASNVGALAALDSLDKGDYPWLFAPPGGIYLYHLAVVTQLEGLGQGGRSAYVLLVVASTAGAALLAWLSYRFVERPAMRLASRRARSQPPLPEPATEPALAPVSAR